MWMQKKSEEWKEDQRSQVEFKRAMKMEAARTEHRRSKMGVNSFGLVRSKENELSFMSTLSVYYENMLI